MKAWHLAIAGLLFIRILGPETAFAFQQTPLPGTTTGEPAAAAPEGGTLKLDVVPPAVPGGQAVPAPDKQEKGGLLGLFPRKLDFGLELLYAPDAAKDAPPVLGQDPADDVTIRGSVKRRF